MDKLDKSLDELASMSRKAPSRAQRGRASRRHGANPYSKPKPFVSGGVSTVYVGNLDWKVTWKDLKDHMKSVGEVEHADVLTYNDGKSSGGGLVRYANAKQAQRAINELTGTYLNGRSIFVREDREHGKGGHKGGAGAGELSGTTVFVGNLSWQTSWQDLKDHMKSAGEVEKADILTRSDGKHSGAGLVTFKTKEAAKKAMKELTDSSLNGRLIFVREDREGGKGGGGGGGGGGRGGGNKYGNEVSVFVGNLPWSTSWQDLKNTFAGYNVQHVDVGEARNGKMRGFAIMKFASDQDAEAAIRDMNGYQMYGRALEVRYDNK